jgi:virginiamycin B lyase
MCQLAPKRLLLRALLAAMATCGCGFTDRAGAQTVTEFTVPTTSSRPEGITVGPDGALWFTESGNAANKIGRITTAGTITEFTIPTAVSGSAWITAGSDGTLWFTEFLSGKIGRITTTGTITEFPIPTAGSGPYGIAAGPDDALWFTERNGNNIGRITTAGTITEFPIPTANCDPVGITAGPDGALWFTESGNAANKIGRITTAGTITEFTVPTAGSAPSGITAGPDGALWFTEGSFTANKIGRIMTTGTITEFPVPTTPAGNGFITAGPDGALWFTEGAPASNKIGRITTGGIVTTEFSVPTAASLPFAIIAGPDGALWFTEQGGSKIGTLLPVPPAGPSPLVASVLPTSRSVQVGHVATVFASIINSSNSALVDCRIVPKTFVNGFFSYQTTDPATNALTGSPNTAMLISAKGVQTYVIAILAGAPYPSANVQFTFICDGFVGAAPIVGVNTLLLTFDANPVPDMIAVGLTPSNDGFAHTGGNGGTGLFVIASDNIGVSASLTARARLSNPSLPITATVCQTNPATAACLATPSASVTATINTNQTSTWAAFLTASGAVNSDPAANRVFFEFVDSGGTVRGSTSTAVTTQ